MKRLKQLLLTTLLVSVAMYSNNVIAEDNLIESMYEYEANGDLYLMFWCLQDVY